MKKSVRLQDGGCLFVCLILFCFSLWKFVCFNLFFICYQFIYFYYFFRIQFHPNVTYDLLRSYDRGIKGRVMGPLLALVWPCFRTNEIVTPKIVSFLCSLNNFLLKNVIVLIFGKHVSKWRSFEEKKKSYFWPISRFLVTRDRWGKRHKISFGTYFT